MKLEDQVCNLELSKRLEELGLPQDSLFWYRGWNGKKGTTYNREIKLSLYRGSIKETETGNYTYYSAFTASELLEILPDYIVCKERPEWHLPLEISKVNNEYKICYVEEAWGLGEITIRSNGLSNACAKMLIHLIENNLFIIDESVNKD
jgi:hypothetical protein